MGRSYGSSSGYVYRNPYAAYPSVHVRGYYRSTGTYVAPHVRTAPNWTATDNLSYRGYGTSGLYPSSRVPPPPPPISFSAKPSLATMPGKSSWHCILSFQLRPTRR